MPIQLTIFIRKKDDISIEKFHRYWREDHGKLFVSSGLAAKYCLKYSQYHAVRSDHMDGLSEAAALPLVEFDGYGEFVFESMEQLTALVSDEEYLKLIVPDEYKFTKRDEWQIMFTEVDVLHAAA